MAYVVQVIYHPGTEAREAWDGKIQTHFQLAEPILAAAQERRVVHSPGNVGDKEIITHVILVFDNKETWDVVASGAGARAIEHSAEIAGEGGRSLLAGEDILSSS